MELGDERLMLGSLIESLKNKFRSLTPLDSETIFWTTGEDGIQPHLRDERRASASNRSAPPALSESGVFPCKIVSKSGAFYNVDKYENGIDNAKTGTAKVYVLQLNFADTLPVGTWIVASESQIGTTGGGNVP
jgi:hypothetical protein